MCEQADGPHAMHVAGAVWLDIVSVPVMPGPAAVPPTAVSGDGQSSSSALPSIRRPTGWTTVMLVISAHHEAGEACVRAWELRQIAPHGTGGQKRPEWRQVEVEVEIPLQLEKPLEHWRTAAYAASSTEHTTIGVALQHQPEGVTASGGFSYLSAAKGQKENGEHGESKSDSRWFDLALLYGQ